MAFDKKKLFPIAAVALFFIAYLFVGYRIYRDYGVSTDEPADYLRGLVNFQRFRGGSLAQYQAGCATMQNENACSYPPFFSMLLYRFAPYDNVGIILLKGYWREWTTNTQNTYEQRHKLTFAFFAFSVFVFFLIGRKILKIGRLAFWGLFFSSSVQEYLPIPFITPKISRF